MSVSLNNEPEFFEVALAVYFKKGLSKSESIAKARKEHPYLFDLYIARVNKDHKKISYLKSLKYVFRRIKKPATIRSRIASSRRLFWRISNCAARILIFLRRFTSKVVLYIFLKPISKFLLFVKLSVTIALALAKKLGG